MLRFLLGLFYACIISILFYAAGGWAFLLIGWSLIAAVGVWDWRRGMPEVKDTIR